MLEKTLKIISFALLLIFLLILFFRPIETGDIWWHLSTGKWIVDHQEVPHEDIFSFTEEKIAGISPQWLGSVLYYAVYELGGNIGLKLFRAFLFISIIAIFFIYAYRKIDFSFLVFLIFLLAYGLSMRCLLRPFVFNFIFIQLFLMILFAYLNNLNSKRLYCIPLMGIIWANIHLGSFVYGILLLSIFAFSSVIRYITSKKGGEPHADSAKALLQAKALTFTLFSYFLVFLFTPYGWEGALYPFKVFLIPSFINLNTLSNAISELKPPVYIFSLTGLWFLILCILDLAALWIAKKNKFIKVLLFVFSLFLFLHGLRGIVFFALLSVYIIVESMNSDVQTKSRISSLFSKPYRHVIYFVIILACSAQIVRGLNDKTYYRNHFVRTLLLDYVPWNPVASIVFLKNNLLTGPAFNTDAIGGYIIWSSYPEIRPFVDGRQYNKVLFNKYLAISYQPDRYWPAAEKEFQFKIAIFDSSIDSSYRLIEKLNNLKTWQLVFMDGAHVVFVKRGEFDLPEEIDQFESHLKSIALSTEDVELLKEKGLNGPMKKIQQFFDPPPSYIEPLEEGATLFAMGYKGAGIKRLIQARKISNQKLTRDVIRAVLQILEKES